MTGPATAPRVAIVCADRGIPLLGRGGASAHLRGIAAGYAAAGATVEAWVRTLSPRDGAPTLPPTGVRALQGPEKHFARWVSAQARRFAPSLVHERHALQSGVEPDLPAPWLKEVNAPLTWESALFRGARVTAADLAAEQACFARPAFVIAVSEPIARWIGRGDVQVVPNGVPALPSPVRKPARGPYVLGFEGTFKAWHGLIEGLPGLRALAGQLDRPLHIELAGDGPLRREALSALSASPFPTTWLGALDAEALAAARSRWHAAWIPEAPWPPPGAAALEQRLGAPLPERWFAPLKEAEAAAAGLSLWKGGALLPPPPPPPTWSAIAASLLSRCAGPPLPKAVASWENATAG